MPGEVDDTTTTQDEVDTSTDEETTDNNQDDTGAGADQETDSDEDSEEDEDTGDSDSDSDADDDAGGDTTTTDDEEDEDDEDDFDPNAQRPGQQDAGTADEPFDIRKLPRDPVTNLIDPEAANKAIQEWADSRVAKQTEQAKALEETRDILTRQWGKVKDRYPHIWENKRLIEEVREKHLNSFGKDKRYLSPMAAAKEVGKLYNLGVRSGTKQAKSKRSVETLVKTNRGGGKGEQTGDMTYQNLRKQALDGSNPAKAKEARIALMKYRREARTGS